MLQVIGAAPGAHTDIDWPAIWRDSKEYREIRTELAQLRELVKEPSAVVGNSASNFQFAATFTVQMLEVAKRVSQQYWRTPSYIYSKALLTIGSVSHWLHIAFYGPNTSI